MEFQVTAFYKFTEIAEPFLDGLKQMATKQAESLGVHGLLILATEGCNATVAGSVSGVNQFIEFLESIPQIGQLLTKSSSSNFQPFRRFKVDLRPEIVTFDRNLELSGKSNCKYLTPAEWQDVLESGEDIVLIDTRNTYECEVGKFIGAIVPPIKKFSDFREYVEQSGIPKEKKVLMYCTGGIRCEKASIEMERQGFKNVFQLSGGILKYLEEFPNAKFEGECFVFDHRVAVDQNLMPSKRFKLCPHCGNAADVNIQCSKCTKSAVICKYCTEIPFRDACSKNCSAHLERVAIRSGQKCAANK